MDNVNAAAVAAEAIIAARSGVPTVLSVQGEAGYGKSRLLGEVLARLEGFQIRRGFGEPDAPDVPYLLLGELTGNETAFDANPLSAVRLLQELVDQLHPGGPVALVIDDLQWTDAESVRALAGFFRRAVGDRLLVVVASRPLQREHPEWQRLLQDSSVLTVELDGLTVEEVADLIASSGAGPSMTLARELHEHTSGNPLHVISLLREHPLSELESMAAVHELPAPLQLAAHMEERVGALSPDAAGLLSALAVVGDGWVSAQTAAAIAGISDVASAVGVLSREGLIRTRGGSTFSEVRLFHAVLRAAVYEIVPDDQRRRLHTAAAATVIDPGARLRHRFAAWPGGANSELETALVDFAATQHDLRHFRDAARYLRLAAHLVDDASTRRSLLLDADCEALLGRAPDAERTGLQVGDAHDRLVVAMSHANRSQWRKGWTTLAGIVADDLGELSERNAFRVLALRAWCGAGVGRPPGETLDDVAEAERRVPDGAMSGLLHLVKAQTLSRVLDERDFWEASAYTVDRSVLAGTPGGQIALAWRGVSFAIHGMFSESISDLAVATTLVGDGALDFNEGMFHAFLGLSQFMRGDTARAAASIDVALTSSATVPHPLSLSISGLREFLGGDPTLTRADMASARSGLIGAPFFGGILTADIVGITVLAINGSASEQSEWTRQRASELGDPLAVPGLVPALWAALHGVAAGWMNDAEAVSIWADRVEGYEIAPEWQQPMVEWLRARAAALRGEDGTVRLAALARAGFRDAPVFTLLVARDAALSAHRHDHREAADLDALAEQLTAALGLTGSAAGEVAASPLPVEGSDEDDPFASLSERERAVASLVVDGMSYAQIAKELFVTRSTVGFHLSNCYAKTGTASRHELAQLARSVRR